MILYDVIRRVGVDPETIIEDQQVAAGSDQLD